MFRLFFIVLTFLFCQNFLAQDVVIHFEGTIYDENNLILRDATVKITQGELTLNAIKSDENGRYNVYLPIDAEYDVIVTKLGYVQKKYFVSTKEITKETTDIQFSENIADIILFTKYDGVDYSLFDKPINKYYYNPGKDNIVYDQEYLKAMKLAMKKFQNAQEAAATLAKEKVIEDKKNAEGLVHEKAIAIKSRKKLKGTKHRKGNRKEAEIQNIADKKHNIEEIPPTEKILVESSGKENRNKLKKENFDFKPKISDIIGNVIIEQKPDKTIVSSSAVIKKETKNHIITELLNRYGPGITEEIFEKNGVYIIQRILVKNDMVWVYQKKIFNWGGVICFRDKEPITEGIFELETKKI